MDGPIVKRRAVSLVYSIVLMVLFIWSTGCAPTVAERFARQSGRPAEGRLFFQRLDREVERAGVNHRGVTPVPGFPYLAANRFLASLQPRLQTEAAFELWLEQLFQLAGESRRKEIFSLPPAAVEGLLRELNLPGRPSAEALWQHTRRMASLLLQHDRGQAGFRPALQEAVQVPDDYSTTLRVLGIYPVTALPFAYFSEGFFDRLREWHRTPWADLAVLGELVAYQPAGVVDPPAKGMDELFAVSNRDAFGLARLSETERSWLAARFSPVFIQDVAENHDLIGAVYWQAPDAIGINGQQPVVYYFLSAAFFRGEPVWQINYVVWYAGRLGENAPWFERGLIDGITLRVSLDGSGHPFMVDLMNNCGCSHQFFPRRHQVAGFRELSLMFDALVPTWLPDSFPAQPIQIRVNSGWHQVQYLGTDREIAARRGYELRPYGELELLPHSAGGYRSMFDAQGIVPGSERVEPYFFFPMGIRNVGAMRQRGRHPIALIGRSHFDDPALFDRYFIWEE